MKNKKRILITALSVALLCVLALITGCSEKPARRYGVFLGINAEQADRLAEYTLVVIEPSEFSNKHIEELHASGKTVYGYMNIGTIEEYRPYCDRFQNIALGIYDDWPDEKWVDAADHGWRGFIIDEIGKQYADMGFDGLFLDNADVYYHYPTEDIFQGLCSIMEGLKGFGIPLIVNGGDAFVLRCMEEGSALRLFDGINQETVFTDIDFESKTYGEQTEAASEYYRAYLAKAKEYGLAVYLLEYSADKELSKQIDAYCADNGFYWYNAKGLELE